MSSIGTILTRGFRPTTCSQGALNVQVDSLNPSWHRRLVLQLGCGIIKVNIIRKLKPWLADCVTGVAAGESLKGLLAWPWGGTITRGLKLTTKKNPRGLINNNLEILGVLHTVGFCSVHFQRQKSASAVSACSINDPQPRREGTAIRPPNAPFPCYQSSMRFGTLEYFQPRDNSMSDSFARPSFMMSRGEAPAPRVDQTPQACSWGGYQPQICAISTS